jgi:hypothetical protein
VTEPAVHTLARAIAERLDGWRYHRSERGAYEHLAYLRHDDSGAEVMLLAQRSPPSARDRIEIKGSYPALASGSPGSPWMWGITHVRDAEPRITVAASRSADSIARDFRERFETAFWPVWRAIAAKHQVDLIEHDRCERLLEDMLGLFPKARRADGREHRGTIWGDEWHARVRVSTGRMDAAGLHADLELHSLPGDVTVEVLRLIASRCA